MRIIAFVAGILLFCSCKKEFSSVDPATDLLRKLVAVSASGDSTVGYFYYDTVLHVKEYRRLAYEAGAVRVYQIQFNWDETHTFVRDYRESFYDQSSPEEKLTRKFILNYDQASQQYASKFTDPEATSPGFQQDSIVFAYDAMGRLRSRRVYIRYADDPVFRRVFFSEFFYKGGYNIAEQTDTTYLPQYDESGNQTGDSAYLSSKVEFSYDGNFNPILFTRKVAYAIDFNVYAASSNILKKVETYYPLDQDVFSKGFDYSYTYRDTKPLTCDLRTTFDSNTSLTRYTYYYESDKPSIPE